MERRAGGGIEVWSCETAGSQQWRGRANSRRKRYPIARAMTQSTTQCRERPNLTSFWGRRRRNHITFTLLTPKQLSFGLALKGMFVKHAERRSPVSTAKDDRWAENSSISSQKRPGCTARNSEDGKTYKDITKTTVRCWDIRSSPVGPRECQADLLWP